jgi:cytochrome c5
LRKPSNYSWNNTINYTINAIVAALLVFTWAPAASSEPLAPRTAQLFRTSCASCHANPASGAPLVGDSQAWDGSRGIEDLLTNVVNGVGRMPPLGMCGACTEDDLRALIRLLVGIGPQDPAK